MGRYIFFQIAVFLLFISCESHTAKLSSEMMNKKDEVLYVDTVRRCYAVDSLKIFEDFKLKDFYKIVFNQKRIYSLNFCLYEYMDSVSCFPDKVNRFSKWTKYYDSDSNLVSFEYNDRDISFAFDLVFANKYYNAYLLNTNMGSRTGYLDGFLINSSKTKSLYYFEIPPSPYQMGQLPGFFRVYLLNPITFYPEKYIGVYDNPDRKILVPERYLLRLSILKYENNEYVTSKVYSSSFESGQLIDENISLMELLGYLDNAKYQTKFSKAKNIVEDDMKGTTFIWLKNTE